MFSELIKSKYRLDQLISCNKEHIKSLKRLKDKNGWINMSSDTGIRIEIKEEFYDYINVEKKFKLSDAIENLSKIHNIAFNESYDLIIALISVGILQG